jgi:hypothetical protein
MNITTRTCANCAAFSLDPPSKGDTCVNAVYFTERKGTAMELHRQAKSTDNCPDHPTQHEDEAETALIEHYRREGGIDRVMRAWPSIDDSREVIRRAQRPCGAR